MLSLYAVSTGADGQAELPAGWTAGDQERGQAADFFGLGRPVLRRARS